MAKVYEYRDLYADGRDLGALTVFHDDNPLNVFDDGEVRRGLQEGLPLIYTLADGFHRYRAAGLAGLSALPCDVYNGTPRDAILYATSHNLHGQPLSNTDKRKRVLTLLRDPEWQQWSDHTIARHCGVTQPFVSGLRKSLITVISEDATPTPSGSLITVISEETAPAPEPRTYTDRYGHTSTMHVGNIGQKAPAPPANGTVAPAPPLLVAEGAEEPWRVERQRQNEEASARRRTEELADTLAWLRTLEQDYGRETVITEVIRVFLGGDLGVLQLALPQAPAAPPPFDPKRRILAKVYALKCETCGDACFDPDADEDWLADLIAAHLGDDLEELVEGLYDRVCDDLTCEDRWPHCAYCSLPRGRRKPR
jgi:hypothetical protein